MVLGVENITPKLEIVFPNYAVYHSVIRLKLHCIDQVTALILVAIAFFINNIFRLLGHLSYSFNLLEFN